MSFVHHSVNKDNAPIVTTTITGLASVPTYQIQTNKPLQRTQPERAIQIIRQSTTDPHPHILIQSLDTPDAMDEDKISENNGHDGLSEDEQNKHLDTANSTMDQGASTSINDSSFGGNRADDEAETNNTSQEISGEGAEADDTTEIGGDDLGPGKSSKYPILKMYYEYGAWVGRNRKATCRKCRHTSASSQPERLIRHLRKCPALDEAGKLMAEDMLVVSNANKKKRRSLYDADETDYYADDDNNKSTDQSANFIPKPMNGPKRLRRDHPDRKRYIDQCLVRFIVCNRIPLKSIMSKEFAEFVRALDPEYKIPSREMITNTLIPGLLNI